jgi:type II secretion system protein H
MDHILPTRGTRSLRSSAGFSIIEIMVIVMIIGLLAAMAIPRFGNLAASLRSRGAADQIAADIAYTRMSAVREGRTAVLTVTGNTYTMTVENTDGSTFKTLRTVRIRDSYTGATIATAGSARIAFDSRGMLKSGSATSVTVTSDSRSQRLLISLIGRVLRDTPQ